MSLSTIKILTEKLKVVKEVKKATGIAIARFIEDAIDEKVNRLPKKVKETINEIS